ncbi:hypothetical protein PV325_003633, partial [Microctonus aethiopoides]
IKEDGGYKSYGQRDVYRPDSGKKCELGSERTRKKKKEREEEKGMNIDDSTTSGTLTTGEPIAGPTKPIPIQRIPIVRACKGQDGATPEEKGESTIHKRDDEVDAL